MRPHFILSTFKAAGEYVSPPGLWTPPSDKAAERLVAAKCIRPATDGEIGRLGHDVTGDSPAIVDVPTMERVLAAGYTEEAAVAIIKRQESLASYIASGMTPDEAVTASAEAMAEAEAIVEATEESAQDAGAPTETEAPEPAPDIETETPAAAEQDAEGEQATEPAPKPEPEPKPKPKPKGKRSKKGRR